MRLAVLVFALLVPALLVARPASAHELCGAAPGVWCGPPDAAGLAVRPPPPDDQGVVLEHRHEWPQETPWPEFAV